jgi:phage tail-like protein
MSVGTSVLEAVLDPVMSYNFVVVLVDEGDPTVASVVSEAISAVAGFSECSGIEGSLQLEPYRQGGDNAGEHRFRSWATWGNIRLRRGVTVSDDLWKWYSSFVEGHGKRRSGLVFLQNDLRVPVRIWRFKRALPLRWSGPALNALEGRVAIEELELAHEGLEQVFAAGF